MNKQKREEEKKILAEMDEAMKEQAKAEVETPAQENAERPKKYKHFGLFEDKTPEKLHCRKCKTVMENGVCPVCGFRSYVPMDEKKQKKIRFVLTCVCLAVFVVLFVWLQVKGA